MVPMVNSTIRIQERFQPGKGIKETLRLQNDFHIQAPNRAIGLLDPGDLYIPGPVIAAKI